MNELNDKAKDCTVFLEEALTDTEGLSIHDPRFESWVRAAYNDPGFLAEDDFISCYDQCRGKRVSDLSDGQVRGCITFLLRQMRHEYGTPRCLVNGELLSLLRRWIELNDTEASE